MASVHSESVPSGGLTPPDVNNPNREPQTRKKEFSGELTFKTRATVVKISPENYTHTWAAPEQTKMTIDRKLLLRMDFLT